MKKGREVFLPPALPARTGQILQKSQTTPHPCGELRMGEGLAEPMTEGLEIVAVAGSRTLPPTVAPLVSAVCRSILAPSPRRRIAVGCAIGADALVLSSGLPPAMVHCFAAFASDSSGAWTGSNVAAVNNHAQNGGIVSWLAGGDLSVPLRARLANRTRKVINAASLACVLFFASPESKGTLLSARVAIRKNLPVYIFPIGFTIDQIQIGNWERVAPSGIWSNCFKQKYF